MANEGACDSKSNESRYTVVIQTANSNDLRVTCKNSEFIKDIAGWYGQLTKQAVKYSKRQKFTNAVTLDCARKDKAFNEQDWEGIVIDYMLSKGFEPLGNGIAVKFVTMEHGRQELKFIFLSPKVSVANPPQYTLQ